MTPEERAPLIDATVVVVLALRREYLRTPGVSVLRHWRQIQNRLRAAARTCESAPEWATRLMRDLQIDSPSVRLSETIEYLVVLVERAGASAWLDLLDREHGYVIALARLEADRRREERDALNAEQAAILAENDQESTL